MDWNNINEDRDTSGLGPIEYDQSKVPSLIRKHANNVRTKTYGQEVREAQARNAEIAGLIASEAVDISNETKGRQDTVETQFNSIQQEMTDKDVISAPEIIAARGGLPQLVDRLNETDAQLAQTANKLQYISVFNYGAKGDGVTDDSDAIKQAISEANDGTVIVLSGYRRKFLISKPILILDKINVELIGVGMVEIYNPNDTAAIEIIGTNFGDTRFCKVKNIQITGTTELAPSDIYIKYSFRGFEVSDCRLTSNAPYGVLVDHCIKGKIEDSEISGDSRVAGVKLLGGGPSSTTTIRVKDNYIWGNAPSYGGDESLYMTYGVHIESAQSNIIEHNIIEGIAKYGVYISHNSGLTNNPESLKNKLNENYYEKMDIGVYIEYSGNNNSVINDEMTQVNKGIYTNESETRIIFGVPHSIEFGVNSNHCIAVFPHLTSNNDLMDNGANNQALFGVNKTLEFLNRLSVRGDSEVAFYDDNGNYKGQISHEGDNLEVASVGGQILLSGSTGKLNDIELSTYKRGITANRPTGTVPSTLIYFDTSIGKPLFRNANNDGWVDGTGADV